MHVYVGSDHAGYELKAAIVEHLTGLGHDVVDCGAHEYNPGDDYAPPCIAAASRMMADSGSLAVVIGGSGNGEQMAANKVKGVRAALVWNDETASLARDHNDANVISLGGRMHSVEEMTRFIDVFLKTPFSHSERHARRIGMIADYEVTGKLPPLPDSALHGRG
jgi:ribose 5-phosphate isomerase B